MCYHGNEQKNFLVLIGSTYIALQSFDFHGNQCILHSEMGLP